MEAQPSKLLRSQTCCLTGHRNLTPAERRNIQKNLRDTLLQLISEGYHYFGAGGALGFDTLAEEIILELRASHPEIKLILVLPCKDQEKFWRDGEIRTYRETLSKADKIIYCSQRYSAGVMQRRDRRLADHANACICYVKRKSGGAFFTSEYAKKQGLRVINLYKPPRTGAQ